MYGKPDCDALPRTPVAAVPSLDLVLPRGFYQFQHLQLLFSDIRQGDGQPHALRVQNAEASPYQSAARRIHGLFEPVLRTGKPVANVDGLPVRSTAGAAIQFGLRGISAPAAPEDAVGTIFLSAAQPALVQHRPDQESNTRLPGQSPGVVHLRDKQGFGWRAIAKELGIPVMTAVDAYPGCTEIVSPEALVPGGKTKGKRRVA